MWTRMKMANKPVTLYAHIPLSAHLNISDMAVAVDKVPDMQTAYKVMTDMAFKSQCF